MKIQYKILLVAIPIAVLAFLLTNVIWPDRPDAINPDASLLPYFLFLSLIECFAFGVGIALAFFGWPYLGRLNLNDRMLSRATFISIVWALVSWWPHDNMHRVNGLSDLHGLIGIMFIYHASLIVVALIIATYFWRQISRATS